MRYSSLFRVILLRAREAGLHGGCRRDRLGEISPSVFSFYIVRGGRG